MSNYETAVDLYFRGFRSEYIESETGLTSLKVIKNLKTDGVDTSRTAIVEYQKKWIAERYSAEDVEEAYRRISKTYPEIRKASDRRQILELGCCFGQYKPVFVAIIGEERYMELRNELWREKQVEAVREKYGVDNYFASEEAMANSAMHDPVAREKRRLTMLERYGVEHPNQNPDIAAKMVDSSKKTFLEIYGKDHPFKVPEIAERVNKKRQSTMIRKYGAANSVQIESIREKIEAARIENGTASTSIPEETMYRMLVEIYGENDVIRNHKVDDRYPWRVDFYIKSRDLFIELNGDPSHNTHWFGTQDGDDEVLTKLIEKRDAKLAIPGVNSTRYDSYVSVWSVNDLEKRSRAKTMNLKYLVFWDGNTTLKNGKPTAILSDFKDWLADGQPDPADWRFENTY